MTFNVSSEFIFEASASVARVKRQFFINSVDYSAYVKKWPVIRRQWDSLKPTRATIGLVNDSKVFNFFKLNPVHVMDSMSITHGFMFSSGSFEVITQLTGNVDRVAYSKGVANVTISDLLKQLGQRLIGDSENSVLYTSSNYYPADIAWYAITSYGGLSSVQSTSNTDIDYDSFSQWRSEFSSENTRVQAQFDGLAVTDVLRKLARLTRSAIFVRDGKLTFDRFTIISSYNIVLDDTLVLEATLDIDDETVINKQIINAGYNVNSDSFAITVFSINTASVNSFGYREAILDDTTIWYIDSASAKNAAERITVTFAQPLKTYEVKTGLDTVYRQIGESVTYTDPFFGDGGETYRIVETEFRMNDDTNQLTLADPVFASGTVFPFILDVTNLDGAEILI